MVWIQRCLAAGFIAIAFLTASCETPPLPLASRVENAKIGPEVIADWIIQGRNDFILIDLRPHADFEKAHIRNAIHLNADKLQMKVVMKSLPVYKKLVFYGQEEIPGIDRLRPVFAKGHHVLILADGFQGWQKAILNAPQSFTTTDELRRAAVVKYFKGESALGTPQPLKSISAEQFVRPPSLHIRKATKADQEDGC